MQATIAKTRDASRESHSVARVKDELSASVLKCLFKAFFEMKRSPQPSRPSQEREVFNGPRSPQFARELLYFLRLV